MNTNRGEKLYNAWDKFWEKENVTILGRLLTKARMKAYKDTISELRIKTAIDVGCGFGHILKIFQDAELEYEGIDVSPNSVNVCRKKGLNARLGRLEDEDKKYDLVESEGMLEHFLNFLPYAEDLARISKKYILLMQPNHESFLGKTLVYFGQLLTQVRAQKN